MEICKNYDSFLKLFLIWEMRCIVATFRTCSINLRIVTTMSIDNCLLKILFSKFNRISFQIQKCILFSHICSVYVKFWSINYVRRILSNVSQCSSASVTVATWKKVQRCLKSGKPIHFYHTNMLQYISFCGVPVHDCFMFVFSFSFNTIAFLMHWFYRSLHFRYKKCAHTDTETHNISHHHTSEHISITQYHSSYIPLHEGLCCLTFPSYVCSDVDETSNKAFVKKVVCKLQTY